MTLWRVQQVVSRRQPVDYSSADRGRPTVTQLLADGVLIANALESIAGNEPAVQAMICGACGIEGCEPGGWVAPRSVGGAVLWLPADDGVASMDARAERGPPDYFGKGLPFFDEASVAGLTGRSASLVSPQSMRRRRSGEWARAVQWAAPHGGLGEVLAVSTGEPEPRIRDLERLLREHHARDVEVTLRATRPGEEPITFFLDGPGHPAWSPMAMTSGGPVLHIDGLVAEPIASPAATLRR